MELITKGDEQSLLRAHPPSESQLPPHPAPQAGERPASSPSPLPPSARAGSAEGAAPGQALPSPETSTSFWVGTYRSFLVILFLEIGDRTFFIAALLSMKSPHRLVFAGAWGALFVMTAISCALGVAAPLLMPRSLTHWAGAVLFVGFGVQLLWKAYNMKAVEGTAEELEEVEGELKETDARVRYAQFAKFVDPIVVQAFVMTFLAEWGDRSQIATITMAADYNPWGITLGGSVGHACATAGAVVGGRLLATRINERTVAICGGLCFLLFGLLAILEDPSIDYSSAVPALFGRGGGGSEAEELADAELAAAEVAAAAQAAEAAAEALNATAKCVSCPSPAPAWPGPKRREMSAAGPPVCDPLVFSPPDSPDVFPPAAVAGLS